MGWLENLLARFRKGREVLPGHAVAGKKTFVERYEGKVGFESVTRFHVWLDQVRAEGWEVLQSDYVYPCGERDHKGEDRLIWQGLKKAEPHRGVFWFDVYLVKSGVGNGKKNARSTKYLVPTGNMG